MSWSFRSASLSLAFVAPFLALLSACGSDVYLGSREPATIEAKEWEGSRVIYTPHRPKSAGRKAVSLLPFPLGVVGEIAADVADGPDRTVVSKTDYSYAVRVTRINGEAVALTSESFQVPPGKHRIEARYCRYEEGRSNCSEPVVLNFRADAGYRYSLRRNSKLQIELHPNSADKKTVRSEAKAVVLQDEEDCIRRRRDRIEFHFAQGWIEADEAARRRSQVGPGCRDLVGRESEGES